MLLCRLPELIEAKFESGANGNVLCPNNFTILLDLFFVIMVIVSVGVGEEVCLISLTRISNFVLYFYP